MHLIDLLSIFLRCNHFTRIQKVVMDQKGSRPTNSDQYPFFGENLALGIALELLLGPSTELIITVHKIRNDNTSQWWFSWFSISSLIEFLTFPVCFKCWTMHRMVNVKFLINFSCNCKRISFSDPLNWSWSTSKGQPWCSSSARLYLCSTSWATLHCMFIRSSWAKCVVGVARCLHCFMIHFELE